MNLLKIYQNKIEQFLINLEKSNEIKLPKSLQGLKIELTPKNQKGDFACNASMILSKLNESTSINFANFLKDKIIKSFPEIKSIDIAKPGFINITFEIVFWKECLTNIINLKESYGSADGLKKKI